MVTDKETQEKRKQICNDCEKNTLGICTECGCVIALKTKWKLAKCPVNKW